VRSLDRFDAFDGWILDARFDAIKIWREHQLNRFISHARLHAPANRKNGPMADAFPEG
jgi:hypothetical protein